MTAVAETSIYYLVFQGQGDNAILAFLGNEPSSDQSGARAAIPVVLELLPPNQRFGGAGGISMGQTVLGRWPGSMDRFRQFLTMSELEQAGWVPVTRYRICDCLEDYYSPWSTIAADQSTAGDSMLRTGTECS
jgi:hypothetical protein